MADTALTEASAAIAALPTDPMRPRPFRVVTRIQETHDTVTLELESADGHRSRPFSPGQFHMLWAFGVGEVPISISGKPEHPDRIVHTLRVVGAVTKALAACAPGATVGLRGPFGTHWPLEAAVGRDVVIVAGGIGLAPLRPAIYEICDRRDRYGRVAVLYGARTPQDILFAAELRSLADRHQLDVGISVDRASEGWRGRVGVVTTLIPHAGFAPRNALAMVCGPEIMERFTVEALRKRGVPVDGIWVSMERNMKCAVGFCGHCQFGPDFLCKDGPVFPYQRIRHLFNRAEV